MFRPFLLTCAWVLTSVFPAGILVAQQPQYLLSPADTPPSLVTPPSAPRWGEASEWRTVSESERATETPRQVNSPLNSYEGTGQIPHQSQPSVTSSAGSCNPCSQAPMTTYRPSGVQVVPQSAPQTLLSPVVLPPAAYSSTYVPPPPPSAYYANRVVYRPQGVTQQAFYSPNVVARPAVPLVAPTQQAYALRPLLPVQNVPVGTTIGQGLLGQPTVYVPGQPLRNFLRYLSP